MKKPAVNQRCLSALIGLALGLSLVNTAHADAKTAEAIFQAGREALSKGDTDAACERFRESFRLEPAAGTLLNLGECEVKRARIASAWQAFHDAGGLLPPSDFRVAYARDRAASLKPRIPTVRLQVDARARAPHIVLDGVELGSASLGVALPLDPGEHQFVVRGAGQREARTAFRITEGERRELTLAAGDEIAAARPRVEPPRDRHRKAWVMAAFGAGAAGIATGAVAGIIAIDAAGTYRDHCDDAGCDPAGIRAASRGGPLAVVSTVGLGVGAVGIAVGSYLLATTPKASGTQAYAAPAIGSNGGSLVIGGHF